MYNYFKAKSTILIVVILVIIIAIIGGYLWWRYYQNALWKAVWNSTEIPITTQEPTTTREVSATTTLSQKVKMFKCGDSVTFTYKGSTVTYGTVYSPATGKCWLDRNLGASRVATAYNDSLAYGDLFQWGRGDDGHQTRTSGTTNTLSRTDNPGHGNFILTRDLPYDWCSPQNDNLWQGVNGINNPCPSGWRIPTSAEWDTERASWSQQNYYGAFASPLKLTGGGIRASSDGSISGLGGGGYYWSSTITGTDTSALRFYESGAYMYSFSRANGLSVRCLKD